MRSSKKSFSPQAAQLLGVMLSCWALPAMAADDVTLAVEHTSGASAQDFAALTVSGSQSAYDRVTGDQVSLALILSAAMAADSVGRKIITSELFLKQDSTGSGARATQAFDGATPTRSLILSRTFAFAVDAGSPVAKDAVALCNGRGAASRESEQTLAMTVPVLWRVTTGRFNFKWTNYDRVAPTDEIQNNPDFYADRETTEVATNASVQVRCAPLTANVAARPVPAAARQVAEKKVEPAPVHVQKLTAEPIPARVPETATAKPEASVPVAAASLASASKPVCLGGMIREVGGASQSYLCLCPGNTERVAQGDNAFSCERRAARQ